MVAFASVTILFFISAMALWQTRLREAEPAMREGRRSARGDEETLASDPASKTGASPSERGGLLADVVAGLRYVRGHPVLPPMLVVVAVAEIATAGPVAVGLPLLADAERWGVGGVGLIMAGFGVGATTTALLVMLAGRVPHAGYVALVAVVIMGPALAAVGLTSTEFGAVIAGCITGLGGGICSTLVSTFVLSITEKSQVGRVVALMSFATFGGAPLSYALSGFIADATNPRMPFVVSGLAVFLVGIVALCVPALRSADMPKAAPISSRHTKE
ncbi:MAG: MFS transporter [Rhodoglobus sp.]